MDFSRREWLFTSLSMATWPEIVGAQEHAHAAAKTGTSALGYLDPITAQEIEALTSQIIPTDDLPGAREAGVIYFIDRALSTFDRDKQDAYRDGLEQLQAKRKALFPHSNSIATLTSEQQIQLLQSIEDTSFFELLRTHTLFGFLGNPSYGGNRGGVGWKVAEFEMRPRWEPPFGYYDAQAKDKEIR